MVRNSGPLSPMIYECDMPLIPLVGVFHGLSDFPREVA